MAVFSEIIKLKTEPDKLYDLTMQIKDAVKDSKIDTGTCNVFCPGSTGAMIINEADPMLFQDIKNALERIAPKKALYHHPDNGYSHIRAALIGCDKSIPIIENKLVLGQWQNVFFLECDEKNREREIFVSINGE